MDRSPPPLRLHMVKGSFFTADDDDGAAWSSAAAMDAGVWSKLPEELVWEVLRFVPAATHFRLQLVSRKWRQVLTSADFRNTLIAAASRHDHESEEEQQQQPARVVACLAPWHNPGGDDDSGSIRGRSRLVKVVDINLSSFVPDCFWTSSDSYHMMAAADGLVCISNNQREPDTMYCVLNPLTRTCKVVPQVPFQPWGWLLSTSPGTTVTIFRFSMTQNHGLREEELHVATCDLAATAGGGGGWDVAAYLCPTSTLYLYMGGRTAKPSVAVCAGETFLYHNFWLGVLGRAHPPDGTGRLVKVAAVNEPPALATLAPTVPSHPFPPPRPDLPHFQYRLDQRLCLTTHRGAVFAVKYEWGNFRSWRTPLREDVVMAVWRVAREPLRWEAVAWLDLAQLERLTGLEWIERRLVIYDVRVGCTAGGLLLCNVSMEKMGFMLGLNLGTGDWEFLCDEQGQMSASWPLELRPDLFL